MRTSDVERWVAEVVDRIQRGQGLEDDRVELKREPKPTPLENARRIAGHANQMREDRILWVFGLDNDGQRHPLPPDLADPDKWWPSVRACFDDVAPSPHFAPVDGLLGVGFDTSRPPYVVRIGNNVVSREVPWREGTQLRSANRFDLLRLLVPLSRKPTLTILGGHLLIRHAPPGPDRADFEWSMSATLYADTDTAFILPDHRSAVTIGFKSAEPAAELPARCYDLGPGVVSTASSRLQAVEPPRLAERGPGQLIVRSSSQFLVVAETKTSVDGPPVVAGADGTARFRFSTAGSDRMDLHLDGRLVAASEPPPGVARATSPASYWNLAAS